MALSRDDTLGLALLLWAGAALLALFLLGNAQAAPLQARLGPTRLWGAVLGLASLGLLLAARRPLAWAPCLGALILVLLPAPQAAWAAPAALLGGAAAAFLGWGRKRCAKMDRKTSPSRRATPCLGRSPRRARRRGAPLGLKRRAADRRKGGVAIRPCADSAPQRDKCHRAQGEMSQRFP